MFLLTRHSANLDVLPLLVHVFLHPGAFDRIAGHFDVLLILSGEAVRFSDITFQVCFTSHILRLSSFLTRHVWLRVRNSFRKRYELLDVFLELLHLVLLATENTQ